MTDEKKVQQLKTQLFAGEGMTGYALLDGASIPDLPGNLAAFEAEHVCLLRGVLLPDQEAAAPYLVRLERDSRFTDWIFANGWGKHWGIFCISAASMRTLRDHFRNFLIAYDETASSFFFRYYDPRVLQVFLPTLNKDELTAFFGPVYRFLAESEDGNSALCFTSVSGKLVQDHMKLG